MKNTTLRVGLRGTVTLPKQLRDQYALTTNDLLLAEPTPEGILLRPAVATAIEIYTDERIAEFAEEERKFEERVKNDPKLRNWIDEGSRRFAIAAKKAKRRVPTDASH